MKALNYHVKEHIPPQTVVAVTVKETATVPLPPPPPPLPVEQVAGTVSPEAPHEAGTLDARALKAVKEAA